MVRDCFVVMEEVRFYDLRKFGLYLFYICWKWNKVGIVNINVVKDFDYFVYFFFFKVYIFGLCVDYFFFYYVVWNYSSLYSLYSIIID